MNNNTSSALNILASYQMQRQSVMVVVSLATNEGPRETFCAYGIVSKVELPPMRHDNAFDERCPLPRVGFRIRDRHHRDIWDSEIVFQVHFGVFVHAGGSRLILNLEENLELVIYRALSEEEQEKLGKLVIPGEIESGY